MNVEKDEGSGRIIQNEGIFEWEETQMQGDYQGLYIELFLLTMDNRDWEQERSCVLPQQPTQFYFHGALVSFLFSPLARQATVYRPDSEAKLGSTRGRVRAGPLGQGFFVFFWIC